MCGLRGLRDYGLQWGDLDWENSSVRVQRSVVIGTVDEVKTVYSKAEMPLSAQLLRVLKTYKKTFYPEAGGSNWVFPTPVRPALVANTHSV